MRPIEVFLVTFLLVLLIALLVVFFQPCREAHAEGEEAAIVDAVRVLQPMYSPPEAAAWGSVFYEAGTSNNLDPLLLVAVAFRESSIRSDVVGSRGERGAMQLHGLALGFAPCERADVADMTCNVHGGAALLDYWRAECGTASWAVWVGAYGLGRCPTEQEAAALQSVGNARRYYERVGGTQWAE